MTVHSVTTKSGHTFEASITEYADGRLTIETEKRKGWRSAHNLMAESFGRHTRLMRWTVRKPGQHKSAVSVWEA